MICEKCNAEIPADSWFCPKCGVKLTEKDFTGLLPTEGKEHEGTRGTEERVNVGDTIPEGGDKTQFGLPSESDRYEVLEVIGEGGMGKVYKARDKKLNRIVAMKRLLKDLEAREKGLARFLKEAQAIAGLNHSNIISIYDIGKDNIGHFIAMEYVEGETLAVRITREGKLKVEDAIPLSKQIAQALLHGHRKGIIHRDIKPANILLTKESVPKVADFGLAQIERESNLSRTGYGMGTIDYMPREQRRDAKNIDHRADIYAFGATLYHMVTGEVPKVIRESKIPDVLREIILKAIEERPEDRYFSIDDMIKDLENAEKGKKKQVSVTVEEGACSNCGAVNPKEIRFCKECGTGLFKKCPKCEHEDRIGVKFCGSCGLNFQQYEEIQKYLQTGKEHLATYNYSRALKEFKAILGLDLNHQEALRLTTESQKKLELLTTHKTNLDKLLESEDFESAEKEIKTILELSPNDEKIVTLLNELPLRIRKRDSGKETQAAQESLKEYTFEEAVQHSRNALELDETNEEAKRILREAEEKIAKIISLLEQGKTLAGTHRYDEAITTWERIFRIHPEHTEAERLIKEAREVIKKINKHISCGKELHAKFLFEEAIEELSKVEPLDPTDTEYRNLIKGIQSKLSEIERLLNTGQGLFDRFQFENAVTEWQKVFDIYPNNNEARSKISNAKDKIQKIAEFKVSAKSEMEKENHFQVVSDCQNILKLNPTDQDAKQMLATAQQKIAKIIKQKIRRRITIAGIATCCALIMWGVVVSGKNHYHINAGRKFLESKQYDRAISEFTKVGRFTVNRESLLVAIGDTHKEAKHWGEALKAYEEARRLTRNKSYIDELISATGYERWVTEGEMLLKKGDHKSRLDAINAFGGALAYKPQDKTLKGRLNEIKQLAMRDAKELIDRQEWDTALEVYSALAAIFPEDTNITPLKKDVEFQKAVFEARKFETQKEWKSAISQYGEAEKIKPDSEDVRKSVASCRAILDNQRQTRSQAEEAENKRDWEKAIALFEKILPESSEQLLKEMNLRIKECRRQGFDEWFNRGNQMEKSKKFIEAYEAYKKADTYQSGDEKCLQRIKEIEPLVENTLVIKKMRENLEIQIPKKVVFEFVKPDHFVSSKAKNNGIKVLAKDQTGLEIRTTCEAGQIRILLLSGKANVTCIYQEGYSGRGFRAKNVVLGGALIASSTVLGALAPFTLIGMFPKEYKIVFESKPIVFDSEVALSRETNVQLILKDQELVHQISQSKEIKDGLTPKWFRKALECKGTIEELDYLLKAYETGTYLTPKFYDVSIPDEKYERVKFVPAMVLRVIAYYERGDYQEAKGCLDQLQQSGEDKEIPFFHKLLGLVCEAQGDTKTALQEYEIYLKSIPQDAEDIPQVKRWIESLHKQLKLNSI